MNRIRTLVRSIGLAVGLMLLGVFAWLQVAAVSGAARHPDLPDAGVVVSPAISTALLVLGLAFVVVATASMARARRMGARRR